MIDWASHQCQEESDRNLQEYTLPEQVETLIGKGKYRNVETKITKVSPFISEPSGCGRSGRGLEWL